MIPTKPPQARPEPIAAPPASSRASASPSSRPGAQAGQTSTEFHDLSGLPVLTTVPAPLPGGASACSTSGAPDEPRTGRCPWSDLDRATQSPERRHFIQGELLDRFLSHSVFRQWVGLAMMVLMVVFCWSDEAQAQALLLVWASAGLSLVLLRRRGERKFVQGGSDCATARTTFLRRMWPIYGVQGALWGITPLFFMGRADLYDQFGCWMILACTASAPSTSVAFVPRLLRAYMRALFITLIACLVLVSLQERAELPLNELFLAFPIFHWWMLRTMGRNAFRSQVAQLGLQYDMACKESEARLAVESKGRFLAAAAHDMRQPVMALSLYAEHLLAYPESQPELAPRIAAASTAVNRMFDSLFDLAHLDSGQVKLHVEPVAIAQALDDLRHQFGPLAAARGIELRLRCHDAVILTDGVRLRRMLGNVLGNAIKYSRDGGRILMSARVRGGAVTVDVWDQGCGIPAADLDRVFEEFYRVDRGGGCASVDGIGLGLSIVARLASALGATVSLKSQPERGTRFSLRLADLDSALASRPSGLDMG